MSIKSKLEERDEDKKIETIISTDEEIELRSLASRIINQYANYVFPELYDIIKAKLLFAGDIRRANDAMGSITSTAAVYPLIDPVHDSFVGNLYDAITRSKVAARKEEDKEMQEQAECRWTWAQDVGRIEEAKRMIMSEASLIGTSYGMAGMEKSRYCDEIRPKATFVSFFELFYDISTSDFYKARWKIRRKIMPMKEACRIYWGFFDDYIDNNTLNDSKYSNKEWFEERVKESNGHVVSDLDFTKIYDIKNYSDDYESIEGASNKLDFLEENVLMAITDDNHHVEVIEYWEEDVLTIMINGHIYYDGDNPYPTGDPFGIVTYESLPGTCHGRGIGHKIYPLQQEASSLYGKLRDATYRHINPMYVINEGQGYKDGSGAALDELVYEPNRVITVSDPTLKNGGISPIDFTNPSIIQAGQNWLAAIPGKAQAIIGTNSYVQGGQGKVERSLGAVDRQIGVTKTRLNPIISDLKLLDQHMFYTWMGYTNSHTSDEVVVRILGDEGYEYHNIDMKTLFGKFDITIDVDAMVEQTRAEKTTKVIGLLQAIAPINIDPISQTPILSPDSIVKFISEQTGITDLKPMTNDERTEYAKTRVEIARAVQEATQPKTSPQPEQMPPQEQSVSGPQPQTIEDYQNLPGFIG